MLGSLLYHVIWLLGVYSEARKSKQTEHRSRCAPAISFPITHKGAITGDVITMRTDQHLSLTKNVTFVSMPNGHLYFSSEDCSTLHSSVTLQCTPLLTGVLLLNQTRCLGHSHLNIRVTISDCTSVDYVT